MASIAEQQIKSLNQRLSDCNTAIEMQKHRIAELEEEIEGTADWLKSMSYPLHMVNKVENRINRLMALLHR